MFSRSCTILAAYVQAAKRKKIYKDGSLRANERIRKGDDEGG